MPGWLSHHTPERSLASVRDIAALKHQRPRTRRCAYIRRHPLIRGRFATEPCGCDIAVRYNMVRPKRFRKSWVRCADVFSLWATSTRTPPAVSTNSRRRRSAWSDVRAVAASRRPGFSKRALAAGSTSVASATCTCAASVRRPRAGRPPAAAGPRTCSASTRRISRPKRRSKSLPSSRSLVRKGQRVCLLCYERHPEGCHRRRIAELVCEELDLPVEHLFASPV